MLTAFSSPRSLARSARVAVVATLTVACAAVVGLAAVPAAAVAAKAPAKNKALLYVSLGDSYAAGFQPTGQHKGHTVGHTDTNGFAYQIVHLATAKGYHFKLVNFGCGGATTTSILKAHGCSQYGPDPTRYPSQSQAAAAEAFLRAHRGQVGLITVSIGGNDVTTCTGAASPIACVGTALKTINANLAVLLPALRAAAGPSVPIVGTTYPDVILGLDLSGSASLKQLATLSVTAFKSLINPALAKAYAAVGGQLVDVTSASGSYTPLTQTTTLAPYGTIPVAVAQICTLTYFCQYHDIHPKTPGYTLIANLVLSTLPKK